MKWESVVLLKAPTWLALLILPQLYAESAEESREDWKKKWEKAEKQKLVKEGAIQPNSVCVENDHLFSTSLLLTSEKELMRRNKRFVLEGSFWNERTISYRIKKSSSTLPERTVRRILFRAFQVWQASHLLRFIHRPYGPVHIEIVFATGSHGDGEPFDGRGQTLAHAFFPRFGGAIHFDDDEKWTEWQGKGLDLYSVAVHEIGHSLGLKHSENSIAIMAPLYQTKRQALHLHLDDLQALEHIYGEQQQPVGQQESIDRTGDVAVIAKAFCASPTVHAMTVLPNGSAYAFSGDYFYQLQGRQFNLSSALLTKDHFHNFLDGPPDAALATLTHIYLFKDHLYWVYDSEGKLLSGFPHSIKQGLQGKVPSHLDAALVRPADRHTYFFKGDKYWKYTSVNGQQPLSRSLISLFKHSSSNKWRLRKFSGRIDAAIAIPHGATFLVAGEECFQLMEDRLQVGYPKKVARILFNCADYLS